MPKITVPDPHQPNDVNDYDLSFDEWFPAGDVITSVVMSCAPVMVTPPTHAIAPGGRTVKVWVYAGGVHLTTYKITVRAITSDGRAKEVELIVKVKEV